MMNSMEKRKLIEYALYKGDEFLALGTKEDLAEFLGVKVKTINFYRTKTYLKRIEKSKNERYIVIKVEDIE